MGASPHNLMVDSLHKNVENVSVTLIDTGSIETISRSAHTKPNKMYYRPGGISGTLRLMDKDAFYKERIGIEFDNRGLCAATYTIFGATNTSTKIDKIQKDFKENERASR